MTIKLIYIGDTFYSETSTAMSPIYHEDGRRSDWGKVSVALRNGDEVHIRPANDAELARAYAQRDRIVADLREEGWVYGIGNVIPGTNTPVKEGT